MSEHTPYRELSTRRYADSVAHKFHQWREAMEAPQPVDVEFLSHLWASLCATDDEWWAAMHKETDHADESQEVAGPDDGSGDRS